MRPLTFGIGIVATNSRISPAPFAKGVTNASAKKPNSLIDRPADSMCAPPPCLPCTRRRARRTSPFRASASRDRPENCARGRGKSQPGRRLATRVERERYPQAQAADGAAPSTRRGPGCRPPCPTVGANPACGDPNPRICYRCSSPSGTRELPAIRGCASVAHWLTSAVIHRRRAGALHATERAGLWVTACPNASTSALTNVKGFDWLMNRLPCTFCDSLVGWPLDGPNETRCAEGAGRLRRLTGCRARQLKPERLSMSSPPGLPAREVLLQPQGGCP